MKSKFLDNQDLPLNVDAIVCFFRGGTDGRRGNFQMNATRWQHPIVHTLILLRVHYICLREKWKKKILMTHKKESISTESVISIGAMTPPNWFIGAPQLRLQLWQIDEEQCGNNCDFGKPSSCPLFYFIFYFLHSEDLRIDKTGQLIDTHTHTRRTGPSCNEREIEEMGRNEKQNNRW